MNRSTVLCTHSCANGLLNRLQTLNHQTLRSVNKYCREKKIHVNTFSAKIRIMHFSLYYTNILTSYKSAKNKNRILADFLFVIMAIPLVTGRNLMKFQHVKEFDLFYVQAKNRCIWRIFVGQITSVYEQKYTFSKSILFSLP